MGSCAAPSAKGDDKFITTDYLQQCLANEVRQAVQSSMQEAAAQLRQQLTETQTLSRQAIAASREAQTAKNGSNIAAILAGAAAVIAVIALIIVLVK